MPTNIWTRRMKFHHSKAIAVAGLILTLLFYTHTISRAPHQQEDPTTETLQYLVLVKTAPRGNLAGSKEREGEKVEQLSLGVIMQVKKFVLFVGYARSGHNIVAALMDAHPHVVISDGTSWNNSLQLIARGVDGPRQTIATGAEDTSKKKRGGSTFQAKARRRKSPQFQSTASSARGKESLSQWKARQNLFTKIYQRSAKVAPTRFMTNSNKGYTFAVPGLWQGKFDRHIDVIGMKGGSKVTNMYIESKEGFIKFHNNMKQFLGIPLRYIHVVRNPYDMIATASAVLGTSPQGLRDLKIANNFTLQEDAHPQIAKFTSSVASGNSNSNRKPKKFDNSRILEDRIEHVFKGIKATSEYIENVLGRDNVLEIHNCELVSNPRKTLLKILNFLEVEVSEHYLDVCAEKVYKSVSRSRDLVVWTPEQIQWVQRLMRDYPMLRRYSFSSD